MGESTKISWTDHTFNPWIGCAKVSQACKSCYAADSTFTRASRARGLELWGEQAARHLTSAENWRLPARWNRRAQLVGRRARVFCASMADVFEDRRDLDPWREKLWDLIEATPWLDWQLLTKRPEHIRRLAPYEWNDFGFPKNAWLGCTFDDQGPARLDVLVRIPAVVHFASVEPLLGPVDLGRWLGDGLDWVITGAESGAKARPMHEAWVRDLRDQCARTGTHFFYKQKIDERGRKVELPLLDGRQWAEMPRSGFER